MTRTRRRVLVLVLALAAFLVPAATAYAVWSTTATVAMSVNTIAVVAPTAPTGVTCTGTGDPLVLSWTAVTGATEYRIYQSPGNTLLRTVTTTGTQFTEAQMATPMTSQKYDVFVRAWNEGGESPSSTPTTEMNFKGNKAC